MPPFQLPLVNTLTLLLSGTTVTWAHHALQNGDRHGAKFGLVLTILLGMLFTSIQALEYHHILTDHLFSRPEAANSGLYGSAFFMATGFHGFHVIIGTIFLTVCLVRLMDGGFTPKQALRLRGGGLVLALRRRGLAVPVHLPLRHLRRRLGALSDPATGRPRSGALLAGALGRCPNCGEGPLFAGFPEGRAALRRLRLRPRQGR